MVEVVIKVGSQDNIACYLHGDFLEIKDDDFNWGRMVDKRRWVNEGKGIADHDENRRHQNARNWPGGFFICKVRGLSVGGLFELFEPHRDGLRRFKLRFDTNGLDLSHGGLQMSRDTFLSRVKKK